jgi:hypothetical protein
MHFAVSVLSGANTDWQRQLIRRETAGADSWAEAEVDVGVGDAEGCDDCCGQPYTSMALGEMHLSVKN